MGISGSVGSRTASKLSMVIVLSPFHEISMNFSDSPCAFIFVVILYYQKYMKGADTIMKDFVQKIADFIMWFIALLKDFVNFASGKEQPSEEETE